MTINESQKWPTDKSRYDKNYLKLYGESCSKCCGWGWLGIYEGDKDTCPKCNGIGYVEIKK